MPLVKTSAIILHSRRWGDADRIITCYTLRFGKLRAIARGARRMKSRLGGSIEPFTLCQMDLFEKPGDSLYRVSQVAMQEPFVGFRENLTLMTAAAQMVNLVAALSADGDPDPCIFEALERGLRSLVASRDPGLAVLLFQIRVLRATGFRPQTQQCASCGRKHLEMSSQFSAVAGGLVCDGCARRQAGECLPLSPGSVAFLQQALQLTLDVVSRLNAIGQVRSEVESAIESYIAVVTSRRWPAHAFHLV